MLVKVKKLDGEKEDYNFEDSDTILSVKATISERVGVPPEQLRLIHQGSPLRDEDTLQQARVTAGSTIHLISQLRGGY